MLRFRIRIVRIRGECGAASALVVWAYSRYRCNSSRHESRPPHGGQSQAIDRERGRSARRPDVSNDSKRTEISMTSGRILLMRHAEKPDHPLDPNLSQEGHQRAKHLVGFIEKTFGIPAFLFASANSDHSRRPLETIEPLSRAFGVPIDLRFADQDYPALAAELLKNSRYQGQLILICWHHKHLPSLAHALGAKHGDYPDLWDPKVFNLIVELNFIGEKPAVRKVVEPF